MERLLNFYNLYVYAPPLGGRGAYQVAIKLHQVHARCPHLLWYQARARLSRCCIHFNKVKILAALK